MPVGYDALPVELTEDAYHIRPPQQLPAHYHQRLNSTDNAVYTRYGFTPAPHGNPAHLYRLSSHKSGNNILKEYNQLFKRKENLSLMHKWDSEDDDEGADIHSSASKSQESGDFGSRTMNMSTRNDRTAFDGYGMNSDSERDRYTGTFAKQDANQSADHGRASSQLEIKTATNKSSFMSNSRTHNKPEPKTVIKANRANVRQSTKQTFRQRMRQEAAPKVPSPSK